MKRFFAVLTLASAVAAVIVATAIPATLHNGQGSSCPGGSVGAYHFVNTQTGGATSAGTLTASFTDGSVWTVTAYKVNQHMQHFLVESEGALITATTNLPGRLVLSHFSCEDVKK
jgi:hypothetical protein